MKNRNTAAILLLLAAAFCIQACGGAQDQTQSESTAGVSTDAPVTETDAPGWEAAVPVGTDLDGQTVVIRSRGDESTDLELDAEEEVGEVLNDAIYARNRALEETLNCQIEMFRGNGWAKYNEDITQIRASVAAGDNAWQIISIWGINSSSLVLENCFYDLTDTPYLDADAPWWNQSAVESLTLAGKRFLMAGDSSVLSMFGGSFVMFVNDTLCQKLEITDIYSLVMDGKWTLDKMTEYAKMGMADLDGNGTMGELDQYGLLIDPYNSADSFYTSANIHQIILKDGVPVYTSVVEPLSNLMETIYPLYFDADLTGTFVTNDGTLKTSMFTSGRVMMTINTLGHARGSFREMEDDYTIVPLPKLDEAQTQYLTAAYNGACLLGVPSDNPDPDSALIVMEAMTAASHYDIIPVYIETCLKEKYARNEQTIDMLEIIRETQYIDVEFLWREACGNAGYTVRNMISQKKNDVASYLAKNEKSVLKSIEKTVTALMSMDAD